MSIKKTYQVIMYPEAHRCLKRRSKQGGMPIGDFVGALLRMFDPIFRNHIRQVQRDGRLIDTWEVEQIITGILTANWSENIPPELAQDVEALREDIAMREAAF